MWLIITLPFLAQGILMAFDEWCYHIRRELPLWERIGHPLDTLSFFLCTLFVLFVPFETGWIKWYVVLALFSTLLVTKDEFVHHEHCEKEEQWVHAVLFTLHPIMLTLLGCIWPVIHGFKLPPLWSFLVEHEQEITLFVELLSFSILAFFFYQLIYWNFVRRSYDQQ